MLFFYQFTRLAEYSVEVSTFDSFHRLDFFDFSNNQGTFWTLVDDYLIFQINNKYKSFWDQNLSTIIESSVHLLMEPCNHLNGESNRQMSFKIKNSKMCKVEQLFRSIWLKCPSTLIKVVDFLSLCINWVEIKYIFWEILSEKYTWYEFLEMLN